MVTLAEDQDFEALCSLHGRADPLTECMRTAAALEDFSSIRVDVLSERTFEPEPSYRGARVLKVCLHIDDRLVETEILFSRDEGDTTIVPYPDFWEPREISRGGNTAAAKPTLRPGETVVPCG